MIMVYEEYNGIENVIVQMCENDNLDVFVFENCETFFTNHFIVNEKDKRITIMFSLENNKLYEKIKHIYSDYEIKIIPSPKKQILIQRGLFNIIAKNEQIEHSNKLNKLIPMYVSYEKESAFEVCSNPYFSFSTMDNANMILIPKNNKGVLTFSTGLKMRQVFKDKREIQKISAKLHFLGIPSKDLRKKSLSELRELLEKYENKA